MKLFQSLMVAAVAVGVVASAQAELAVDWTNPNGYWDNADSAGAGTVTGGGIYGVLILDDDGIPGVASPSDLLGGGTALAMADLAAVGGNEYGYGATINVGGDGSIAFTGGFVFARIFQASDALSAAVPGTWYYDGPALAVVNVNKGNVPPDLSQLYNANRDASIGGFGGDPLSTAQVVPEPTTLALLGLGMLTAFWRRRK